MGAVGTAAGDWRRLLLATMAKPGADADAMGDAARAAGLRYADPSEPGIKRIRRGRGFSYRDADGRPVRDPDTLTRIRSLAIPPAWRDVWICASPRGHLQAMGRDARERRQYRYHPTWTDTRGETKFGRSAAFARALPRLRRRVARDLRLSGLPRDKVLAAVVRLLDRTLMRVGNEEYARANQSYGLTTLRNRHAHLDGRGGLKLSFRGKSGKRHEVGLRDRRLARVIRACQDLPGQRLFAYRDEEGAERPIDSDDVNEYLRRSMGDDFSAKDFRTWAATVLAARELGRQQDLPDAVRTVAQELGNTPAVCRASYIHPAVIEAADAPGGVRPSRSGRTMAGLNSDERAVLALLTRRHRRAA